MQTLRNLGQCLHHILDQHKNYHHWLDKSEPHLEDDLKVLCHQMKHSQEEIILTLNRFVRQYQASLLQTPLMLEINPLGTLEFAHFIMPHSPNDLHNIHQAYSNYQYTFLEAIKSSNQHLEVHSFIALIQSVTQQEYEMLQWAWNHHEEWL